VQSEERGDIHPLPGAKLLRYNHRRRSRGVDAVRAEEREISTWWHEHRKGGDHLEKSGKKRVLHLKRGSKKWKIGSLSQI